MYQSETSIRVRYGETDQMGYVYYGVYAMYYEVARVESFRKLGVSYKKMEESGVLMPVLENTSKFIAPAGYDELLRIETIIREKPGMRITFEYKIYNEAERLINIGSTRLAFINIESRRPCPAPTEMMEVLEPYFKGSDEESQQD